MTRENSKSTSVPEMAPESVLFVEPRRSNREFTWAMIAMILVLIAAGLFLIAFGSGWLGGGFRDDSQWLRIAWTSLGIGVFVTGMVFAIALSIVRSLPLVISRDGLFLPGTTTIMQRLKHGEFVPRESIERIMVQEVSEVALMKKSGGKKVVYRTMKPEFLKIDILMHDGAMREIYRYNSANLKAILEAYLSQPENAEERHST